MLGVDGDGRGLVDGHDLVLGDVVFGACCYLQDIVLRHLCEREDWWRCCAGGGVEGGAV